MENEKNPMNGIPDAPDSGGQSRTEPDADGQVRTEGEPKKPDTKESAQEPPKPETVSENEKAYADALRKLLGVSEHEKLDGLDERIKQFQEKAAAALMTAKNQIITAELKAMTGYDVKLLDRLLDRSQITVDDSGKVTGLSEAVSKAAKEFPAVVLPKERKPFVPVGDPADSDERGAGLTMNELIRGKRA